MTNFEKSTMLTLVDMYRSELEQDRLKYNNEPLSEEMKEKYIKMVNEIERLIICTD